MPVRDLSRDSLAFIDSLGNYRPCGQTSKWPTSNEWDESESSEETPTEHP